MRWKDVIPNLGRENQVMHSTKESPRGREREMMEHLLLCERCERCASCSTSQDVINQKDDSKHPLLSGKTHSGTKDGQERERERKRE